MHKIIKYFHENKLMILKISSITILALIIIQLLNNMYKNRQVELSENVSNIDSRNSTIDNYSDYIISDKTNISKSDGQIVTDTMEEFVNYCNENNIESAYNMLTDECKELLFSDIKTFYNNYVSNIFTEKMYYTMQAWSKEENKYTFLVQYTGDILANGGNSDMKQEYYTFIKQEDNTFAININNYIYSQDYEKLVTDVNGIKCEIISKDVFKEYVEYEFRITNETENDILLNGDKYKKNIYLLDDNNVSYSSVKSEFEEDNDIVVKSKNTRKFKIKFNKVYNTDVVVKKLVFNDIVLNYEEYLEAKNNGTDYSNREKIKFKLVK